MSFYYCANVRAQLSHTVRRFTLSNSRLHSISYHTRRVSNCVPHSIARLLVYRHTTPLNLHLTDTCLLPTVHRNS